MEKDGLVLDDFKDLNIALSRAGIAQMPQTDRVCAGLNGTNANKSNGDHIHGLTEACAELAFLPFRAVKPVRQWSPPQQTE